MMMFHSKELIMKKALIAVVLMVSTSAFAACPTWAPYGCTPGANGKMICGCGR
jgi:hypothetical protein